MSTGVMKSGVVARLCALSATLVLAQCEAPGRRAGDIDIPTPRVLYSENGVLSATLTAAPAEVTVADRSFVSNVFNGDYLAPVLRLQRGDRLRLTFVNRIDRADIEIEGPEPSNLHYHGMAIPPVAPADDIFLSVPSGAGTSAHIAHGGLRDAGSNSYVYEWTVPSDHPQGLHWYHPHLHGRVEGQVLSGLSGLIYVDGFLRDHYPELASLTEHILYLRDIELPGAPDGAAKTKTINGVAGGVLRMRPGEIQIWEMGNLGADSFFDISVDGTSIWALSHDGNILIEPSPTESVFLPPASRAGVAIRAPARPGRYAIRTHAVDTGPQGDANPETVLATLIVEGASLHSEALVARLRQPAVRRAEISPTIEQIRALPITRRRTITYTESADGNTFFIDGRQVDMNRIDVRVRLGDVEEWTIRNMTGERHTFHIHQLDYLVTSINRSDEDARGLRDNIDVPYLENGVPGEVRIIVPFTNPSIVGRFVYHCHILEHEDKGMMAVIEVRR